MMRSLIIAGASVAALAGCTGFVSEPYDFNASYDSAPSGYVYSLPIGYFEFGMIATQGLDDPEESLQFQIQVFGPTMYADEAHTYVLALPEAPFHEDVASIYFFPGTRFIREVRLSSSGQLDEILSYAAKAGSEVRPALESAIAPDALIGSVSYTIDITDPDQVAIARQGLEDALADFLDDYYTEQHCADQVVMSAACRSAVEISDEMARLHASGRTMIEIDITPLFETVVAPETAAEAIGPIAACESDICYRPLREYQILVRFGGFTPSGRPDLGSVQRRGVRIPNGSPIVALGIDRPLFARRISRVSFTDNGVPDIAWFRRESEAGEAIEAPFSIIGSIVGVVVSPFTGTGAEALPLPDVDLARLPPAPNYASDGAPRSFVNSEPNNTTIIGVSYPPDQE